MPRLGARSTGVNAPFPARQVLCCNRAQEVEELAAESATNRPAMPSLLHCRTSWSGRTARPLERYGARRPTNARTAEQPPSEGRTWTSWPLHAHRCSTWASACPQEQALACLRLPDDRLPELLQLAHEVRMRHCGPEVEVEGIVSLKTGGCPEDCHFC